MATHVFQQPHKAGAGCLALLLLAQLLVAAFAARPTFVHDDDAGIIDQEAAGLEKSKRLFKSPLGLFIQEEASKMLPGPGQHFSFGALK